MTIRECYDEMGGDFARTRERLCSDDLIERFIVKFPNDDSYTHLCDAIREGRHGDAFRAAHTLKGLSANLGFTRLLTSAEKLSALLRTPSDTIPGEAVLFMEEVRRDYELTVTSIRSYMNCTDCHQISTNEERRK